MLPHFFLAWKTHWSLCCVIPTRQCQWANRKNLLRHFYYSLKKLCCKKNLSTHLIEDFHFKWLQGKNRYVKNTILFLSFQLFFHRTCFYVKWTNFKIPSHSITTATENYSSNSVYDNCCHHKHFHHQFSQPLQVKYDPKGNVTFFMFVIFCYRLHVIIFFSVNTLCTK